VKRPIAHPLAAAVISVACAASARAGQVVFDGSLPNTHPGPLAPVGTTFTIDPASGYLNGTNLFHSFQYFNINSGETAHFTGDPTTIQNVIARVTGGMPSTINGTVTSDIPSFWFINPAGVIVGQGAVLNVANNLALATADFVQFSGGERWYAATTGGTPVNLIVSDPVNFGLLPGSRGGNLKMTGAQLGTPGGGVSLQLAGGDVTINNLTLADRATFRVAGPEIDINGVTSGADSSLAIVGGSVSLQNLDFSHAADEAFKHNAVYSSIQGSDVTLRNSSIAASALSILAAGSLSLDGSHLSTSLTVIGTPVPVVSVGAPNIVLRGQQISITGGTTIAAESSADSQPGNVSITAYSSILIDKSTIEATGSIIGAGNVAISASGTVAIVDGALINTSSALGTPDPLIGPAQGGGNIDISGGAVAIQDSRLSSTEQAKGQASLGGGNIQVSSLSSVTLDGSTIDTSSEASGNAGTISISAPTGLVTIQNQSKVASEYMPDPDDATTRCQCGRHQGLGTAGADSRRQFIEHIRALRRCRRRRRTHRLGRRPAGRSLHDQFLVRGYGQRRKCVVNREIGSHSRRVSDDRSNKQWLRR
jgi:filamentous hemagglutinin family protein